MSPSQCNTTDQGAATSYSNPDDYEKKYPEDCYGEEFGASARVWRTYIDEADKADTELTHSWKDTTDVLLVFTGLFSGVVTTFIVQTSTLLQPDYTQISASLLYEQVSLMRASQNGTSFSNIPQSSLNPNSVASPSATQRWMNGLFVTSLAVTLSTAFIAVLAKQWMQHYISSISGTPQHQVRLRQFRYLGIERWSVSLIIGGLPILLHLALLLFFAGLTLFVVPLDASIAYITIVITVMSYTFYFVSNLLPLWDATCPYKTPLSVLLLAVWLYCSHGVAYRVRWLRGFIRGLPLHRQNAAFIDQEEKYILNYLKITERKAALDRKDEIDAEALLWLYSASSNPAVTSIVIQAISGLKPGFSTKSKERLKRIRLDVALETLKLFSSDPNARSNKDELGKVERYSRAYRQLGVHQDGWPQAFEALTALDNFKISSLTSALASSHLETYTVASRDLLIVSWGVLLRRSILCLSSAPLDQLAWHIYRVLDNFVTAYRDRDHSVSKESWQTRVGMMFSYFSALKFDNAHRYDVPSANRDFLSGADFELVDALPQAYSSLCAAIPHWQSLARDGYKPINAPATVIRTVQRFLTDYVVELQYEPPLWVQMNMDIRYAIQDLVDVNTSSLSDEYADGCIELLFDSFLFGPLASRMDTMFWTVSLITRTLRCNITGWQENSQNNFFSFFSSQDHYFYKLFEECDGIQQLKKARHNDTRYILYRYLSGLLDWQMGATLVRSDAIDYLLKPDNLAEVIEECTIKMVDQTNGTGTYEVASFDQCNLILRLFNLHYNEDSALSWHGGIRKVLQSSRDNQCPSYAMSTPTNEFELGWRSIAYLAAGLRHKTNTRFPMFYVYINGLDIEIDAKRFIPDRQLLYVQSQPSPGLHPELEPVYGPYAIPFMLEDRVQPWISPHVWTPAYNDFVQSEYHPFEQNLHLHPTERYGSFTAERRTRKLGVKDMAHLDAGMQKLARMSPKPPGSVKSVPGADDRAASRTAALVGLHFTVNDRILNSHDDMNRTVGPVRSLVRLPSTFVGVPELEPNTFHEGSS